MVYLLNVERRHNTPGMWSKSSDKAYDRYHTTYCAVVGLLSYELFADAQGKNRTPFVIPRAFYVRNQ